jgi:hypothetical protein
MKQLVIGAIRNKGISYKNNPEGVEYDMIHAQVLVPFQAGGGKNNKVTGHGLQVADIPVSVDALPQFAAFEGRYPLLLELDVDQVAQFGKLESIVVGVKESAKAVKAA